jgi:hypothetical protein
LRARPIGVRAAATMTASVTEQFLLSDCSSKKRC